MVFFCHFSHGVFHIINRLFHKPAGESALDKPGLQEKSVDNPGFYTSLQNGIFVYITMPYFRKYFCKMTAFNLQNAIIISAGFTGGQWPPLHTPSTGYAGLWLTPAEKSISPIRHNFCGIYGRPMAAPTRTIDRICRALADSRRKTHIAQHGGSKPPPYDENIGGYAYIAEKGNG